MKNTIRFTLLNILLFCFMIAQAQERQPWSENASVTMHPRLLPGEQVKSYRLDKNLMRSALDNSPRRKDNLNALRSNYTIYFPSPEGKPEAYKVVSTSVLSPGLAARYPQISSYKGVSLEHPGRQIHFSMDPSGFHGMIREPGSTWYLNPETYGSDEVYLANKSQFPISDYQCLTEDKIVSEVAKGSAIQQRLVNDASLRTFRLALACTGEYAVYHINKAGTSNGSDEEKKASVLAAMNTTMTRVNGIFENDLALTMEIIDNNDEIIFLNPQTDNLTNNDGSALLDEISGVINGIISSDSYDIGHVFSTGGGGIAQVASPCTTNKARGVTGLSSPEGDAFDIDFVAHEMGHQMGATHTFNNSCSGNRTDITAVEPGSGSTIMAYAGICAPNIVGQSDDYFHAISIEQIWTNITIGNSTCANETALGNNPPALSEPLDYTIPAGTPFVLEAQATDSDGDLLTYCWEQQDNEVSLQPPLSNASDGPMFRSRPPSESPARYFPAPESLFDNDLSPSWETLPTVSRQLDFSIMVRDNNPAGGQGSRGDTRIEVYATANPFRVTSQSTASVLEASQVETITWEVGETNLEPINTEFVDIYLIVNEDLDNPVIIEENTPNDGSQNVVIPAGITSNNARIMVKGANNIFFALNGATLQIQQNGFALELSSLEYNVCQPQDLTIPFTYRTFAGFNETTEFTADNISEGLDVSFSNTSASADNTSIEITISGTPDAATGANGFTLTATAGGETKEYPILINIFNNTFETISLASPADNSIDLLLDTTLEWDPADNTTNYQVEIATDAAFSNIVETASVSNPLYHPENLEGGTQYYWRVSPVNDCGMGAFSSAFNFSTIAINSVSYQNNTRVNIPSSGTPTVTSTIQVDRDGDLNKLRVGVDISHTYVQDLKVTLTSPNGRVVSLLNLPCGENNDIDVIFDDDGSDLSCGSNPAISGVIVPEQELASFKGESILGLWTLTVIDSYDLDGGSINEFSMEIFVNGNFKSDQDGDGVLDGDDQCPGTPTGTKVDVTGCPLFSLPATNYTVRSQGESCRDNEDGLLEITTEESLNYTATLTGNGTNLSTSFTAETVFEGLSGGTYQLCFTVEGESGYEQCFEVIVDEPQPLSVLSKADTENKVLDLTLEGASLYFIELNGVITTTEEQQISLSLEEGINTLKVSTTKGCQGEYREEIIIGDPFRVFPNPVQNTLNLNTEEKNSHINLAVYAITGQCIWRDQAPTSSNGRASTDLSFLTAGVYILEVTGENTNKKIKLIKQ